jgi:hypothetical protein
MCTRQGAKNETQRIASSEVVGGRCADVAVLRGKA